MQTLPGIHRKAIKIKPCPPTRFIGIDPGKTGGLACIAPFHAGRQIYCMPMPDTGAATLHWLSEIVDDGTVVYIEKVHSMPNQGVVSCFTFGKGFGELLMACECLGAPAAQVHPHRWMSALGIRTRKKSETITQWKEFLRTEAESLFPELPQWGVKGTIGKQRSIADALLIAEYCRRVETGDVK